MTRLDLIIQKYPDHEEAIRLLASRDPSGNLKYLDWSAKLLASKQALAPEIADVVELFNQFKGFRRHIQPGKRGALSHVRSDLYTYKPDDFASLRDLLFKLKSARDKKREKREQLYHIDGSIEADVIYDSPDLIVRHIMNKDACVHYGLQTKWCIAMRREAYFEDYDSNNAVFFFFERKSPVGDEFDKVAIMVPRSGREETVGSFTSLDRQVDMVSLAKVFGVRVFDIFRMVFECSERYPASDTFSVYTGTGTERQTEAVYALVKNGKLDPYAVESTLEAICCNDAATLSLLTEIAAHGSELLVDSMKTRSSRMRKTVVRSQVDKLTRTIAAALAIHPSVPDESRERLVKELRRRHIDIRHVRRITDGDGRVGVSYRGGDSAGMMVVYRRRRRTFTLTQLRALVRRSETRIVRANKAIKKLVAKKAKKRKSK